MPFNEGHVIVPSPQGEVLFAIGCAAFLALAYLAASFAAARSLFRDWVRDVNRVR